MQKKISAAIRKQLICAAVEARQRAYAPYSRYKVGAAVLTQSGTMYVGCNVENVSFGLTVCAERVAIQSAVAQGHTAFKILVVCTVDGGMPCGACRQVMNEFSPNLRVWVVTPKGRRIRDCLLTALLPDAFGPDSLA